jgi:hypothetical protein
VSEIASLSIKLIEFHERFDKWHCGLNQLKRFKSLGFKVFSFSHMDINSLKMSLHMENESGLSRSPDFK